MALLNVASSIKTPSSAFMEEFVLTPTKTGPLDRLTFGVKDMFDVKGYVTAFGNPSWKETHFRAKSDAPTITTLLNEGATCVGTLITDELAYSIMGENIHYGTPRNGAAPRHVPGGSSSGSAAAVSGWLVDFSIGTDCIGSARLPASYCGIFGMRPSQDVIPSLGVIPMAQSLDTIGWFARDPSILDKVGRVLLGKAEKSSTRPSRIFIAEDCFQLSSIPQSVLTETALKAIQDKYAAGITIETINIGEYLNARVPSLKHFNVYNYPPLAALNGAMQTLARYEFKVNHGGWVDEVKPNLGPGVAENVSTALKTTGAKIDICHAIFSEARDVINELLGEDGVLLTPTVAGPPPTVGTNVYELSNFNDRNFTLFTPAGVAGACQISIPAGTYEGLPISFSLVAKHGADTFLLSAVEEINNAINATKEEAKATTVAPAIKEAKLTARFA
ncbi:hypothetical protein VNO77_33506 [Canavalia gladiata]|uniref:Amidase domain-containing protein n=1 Tax=Canavalia gladiata TaxID=3824 RepID=A0AAN9PYZ3_CANGL